MSKKKITRISLHLFFWVVAWLFLSLFFTSLTGQYSYMLLFATLVLIIAIGTTYVYNYVLIPKYLLRKKFTRFILLSAFTVLISLWLELLGILFIFLFLLTRFNSSSAGLPLFIDPVFLIAGLYLVVIAGVTIRLVRVSFIMQAEKLKLDNLKLEMENKLKESELNSLRTQFHPHFLFNTLNNLYWLTLNKSEQAPQLVLKLSDLLDYNLHQSNHDRVSLEDEINYIRNYLDIMIIRFQETSDIHFSVNGSIAGRMIAPLILITFVENACKHGLSQLTEHSWIHIYLETGPSSIQFSVENNYPADASGSAQTPGNGLRLAQSRLNLIYPEKHALNLQQTDTSFKATLTVYD